MRGAEGEAGMQEWPFMEARELLRAARMEEEALRAALQYADRHKRLVERGAACAYEGEPPDYALLTRYGPLQRLAILCAKLPELKSRWQEAGLPEAVFYSTASDLSLHAALYLSRTGKPGLSRGDALWLRHLFGLRIFKLGSLQFQLFEMVYLDEETVGAPYMTFSPEQKRELPAGTPVINVHVQAGADLSPDAVERSLREAVSFFAAYFPEHRYAAFLCYSWLLYPGMRALLPADSNIRAFASRFTILSEIRDDEQAIERLFGGRSLAKRGAAQTSLQRNALRHPECLGFACGVLWRDRVKPANL